MSVLDFFISRSGYMANSYLTDETVNMLTEAVGDSIETENCVDKWVSTVRDIGLQVYDLQFNTDMRPSSIQEFEALNERIRILSDKIANLACYTNACNAKYVRNSEAVVSTKMLPHLVHLMAHKAELLKRAESGDFYIYAPKVKIVSDPYRLNGIFSCIDSELCSGLSNKIIDIPILLDIRDDYALEIMYSYQSFRDLFHELFGDEANDCTPFVYEVTRETDAVNYLINRIKADHDCLTACQITTYDDPVKFIPYKAIAKTSLDNLDDLYGKVEVPDNLYDRVARMAYTVVNVFNNVWLSGCCHMLDVLCCIKRMKLADILIDELHKIMMTPAESAKNITE